MNHKKFSITDYFLYFTVYMILQTFKIKWEPFLRLVEIKNKNSITYSIDDCTWTWTDTDNYTVWWNVVSWIKNKEDAIWYANYLLSDEWYEKTEMKYWEWKRVFRSWRWKSPLVDFALDTQEYEFK